MGSFKGAKMSSNERFYMARRGKGNSTQSSSLKVDQVYPAAHVNQGAKRPKLRKSRTKRTERDSIRHIPVGHSKTMTEWWESLLRNGGVIGDSVLKLTGVNNGRGDSELSPHNHRTNEWGDFTLISKTTESNKSTGRLIPSLTSSELTPSTRHQNQCPDSLRELSRKKCSLRFWRDRKRLGFTLLINHSMSQARVLQFIRTVCIASVLFIIMRNHAGTIFQCFCFTPSLLVILLLSVLAYVITE